MKFIFVITVIMIIFYTRGDSGTIGSSNLSTVTNMNIDEVDSFIDFCIFNNVCKLKLFKYCIVFFVFQASIVFKVTDGPFYGHLFVEDEVGLAIASNV